MYWPLWVGLVIAIIWLVIFILKLDVRYCIYRERQQRQQQQRNFDGDGRG